MSATEPKESRVGLNEANRSRCESGPLLPPEQPNAPPASPAPEGLTSESAADRLASGKPLERDSVAIARDNAKQYIDALVKSHEALRGRIAELEAQLAERTRERDEARKSADCPMLMCPYEKRVQELEATLTALRERLEPIRAAVQREYVSATISGAHHAELMMAVLEVLPEDTE
jgi:hypothetical protein